MWSGCGLFWPLFLFVHRNDREAPEERKRSFYSDVSAWSSQISDWRWTFFTLDSKLTPFRCCCFSYFITYFYLLNYTSRCVIYFNLFTYLLNYLLNYFYVLTYFLIFTYISTYFYIRNYLFISLLTYLITYIYLFIYLLTYLLNYFYLHYYLLLRT